MIFSNGTEKLLMKKSLVLFALAILISQLLFKFNIQLLIGVSIGYAVSLIRLRSLSEMIGNMLSNTKISLQIIVKYFGVQLLTVVLLFACADKSLQIFFAASIGISIITLTIMVNALTEAIGVTNNNFEYKT